MDNEYHYLPVDERVTEWGFYLTTAGRVLRPVSPAQPHGNHPEMYLFDTSPAPVDAALARSPRESGRVLPEFQVAYISESHAVFESEETGVIEFNGPTLLFLFPGIWHRYRPVGSEKGWLTARWVGFNGDLAYRMMQRQTITPATAVRPAARPRRLAAAFDRMVDRVADAPGADPILLSMRAMDLLADCIESAQDGAAARNAKKPDDAEDGGDALVARMLDLIWTGSHRMMSMDELCATVGANRRTMERRFHAVRGHGLLTEVNQCRCRRARHFLETTELRVKNIRWLAGFRTNEHMRLTFQQLVGMSPEEYRQCHRQSPQTS